VIGGPLGLVTSIVVLTLITLTAGLAITAVLALGTLVALLACNQAFTTVQRSRFAGLLDVRIAPVPRRHGQATWLRRQLAEARAASTWLQIAYHACAAVTGTVGFALAVAAWTVGLVLSTVAFYGWSLPTDNVFGVNPHDPLTVLLLTLLGLAMLLAAPWVVRGATAMDIAMACAMLGPNREDELARRVATLAESRADVVDAADAERRRIERDLHDGTQQRLVSLAMNLGVARNTLNDIPESARDAIAQAHDEAKQALSELRDFVRGLHPAVLDDRGLDAALSGISARAPVPVRLRVDLPRRPPPAIETIAYFVVSEALTNAAKHAYATQVEITVLRDGNTLRLVIADDGIGGARIGAGSGLHGLSQRVGSVDGTLRIDSPSGGPTVIVVELPCEQ
jgi:signal transduction histidine kinase